MLAPITIGTESLGSQPFLMAQNELNRSQATLIEAQSVDCGRRSILELENRDLS